jgi:hypothetical protein
LFTASDNIDYRIYLYSWLWVQGGVVLGDLLRNRMALDAVDLGLWIGSVLAVYITTFTFISLWAVFGFLMFLILRIWLNSPTGNSRRVLFGILSLVIILGISDLEFPIIAWGSLTYLLHYRPVLLLAFFLWPWLIFKVENKLIIFRVFRGHQTQDHTVALICLTLWGFFQINDWGILAKQMKEYRRLWPESQKLITLVRGQRRVVAPNSLWIYTQRPGFQTVETLPFVERYTGRPLTQSLLMDYKPSLILWPRSLGPDPMLSKGYEYHRSWNTVFGEVVTHGQSPWPSRQRNPNFV